MSDSRVYTMSRTPGRRATDYLPDDWATARPMVEMRIDAMEGATARHGERFDSLSNDLHEIRQAVVIMRDRQAWILSAAAVIFAGAVSAGFYMSTQTILRAIAPAAETTQEERLEALADRIEAGDLPRTTAGPPRLYDLQQALPGIRGISRSERAAACLRAAARVPGVCSPPSP